MRGLFVFQPREFSIRRNANNLMRRRVTYVHLDAILTQLN